MIERTNIFCVAESALIRKQKLLQKKVIGGFNWA